MLDRLALLAPGAEDFSRPLNFTDLHPDLGNHYIGTAGDNTQTGTKFNDTFDYSQGGEDTLNGLTGADTFTMGAAFDAGDKIDGGPGTDTLILNGDYSDGVQFTDTTVVNI